MVCYFYFTLISGKSPYCSKYDYLTCVFPKISEYFCFLFCVFQLYFLIKVFICKSEKVVLDRLVVNAVHLS
jgi:hypothetical protein